MPSQDLKGNERIIKNRIDMGAYEHENNLPIVSGLNITINENKSNGSILDSIIASDADNETLYYTIESGNAFNTFTLDYNNGIISIADSSKVDYELIKEFTLKVHVTDTYDAVPCTVKISINNLNDNAPVIYDSTFQVVENSDSGLFVGQAFADDIDYDTTIIKYSLISGNTDNSFVIDSITGKIFVNNSNGLDYETIQTFTLLIGASDGENSSNEDIVINIENDNDNTPILDDEEFSIDEGSENGTLVGTLTAYDLDGDLNSLKYYIDSGNVKNTFAVDSINGKITLVNTDAVEYDSIPSYLLKIRVSDGLYESDAYITININEMDGILNPESSHNYFNIYPNPTSGILTVSHSVKNKKLTIEINSVSGKLCHKEILHPDGSESGIDLDFLPAGTYYITISGDDIIHKELIVKH